MTIRQHKIQHQHHYLLMFESQIQLFRISTDRYQDMSKDCEY